MLADLRKRAGSYKIGKNGKKTGQIGWFLPKIIQSDKKAQKFFFINSKNRVVIQCVKFAESWISE